MKIRRVILSFCLFLGALGWALNASAMLPPKYLSVHKWQDCVGSYTKGSAQFVCIPAKKPKGCSHASWKRLIATHELSPCPKAP